MNLIDDIFSFSKTVLSAKVIGVRFSADNSQPNLLDILKTNRQFITHCKTLKTKQQTIENFALQKFFFTPHGTQSKKNREIFEASSMSS